MTSCCVFVWLDAVEVWLVCVSRMAVNINDPSKLSDIFDLILDEQKIISTTIKSLCNSC